METSYPDTQTPPQVTGPNVPPTPHQGPGFHYPGGAYYITVQQKLWSGWAVTGFIFSFVGLGLVGLPISIMGLKDTSRGEKQGSGLAVAGTALGIAWSIPNMIVLISVIWTLISRVFGI